MAHADSPPRIRPTDAAPSLAVELSWLLLSCRNEAVAPPLPPALVARAQRFWGDGHGLSVELLLVAGQCGCLTGWDITPLFQLGAAGLTVPAPPALETEATDERERVAARLARLARSATVRRRYSALLRDLWSHAEPSWTRDGRASVERALARMQASFARRATALDLVPARHIARRADFAGLLDAAAQAGAVLVTPSYFAGAGGHLVALPGVLSVAVGAALADDPDSRRRDAERVAASLKVFGDPTRVLMLGELARAPATVGDIARRVGIAQATASVHLRLLREAGLLDATRQAGRSVYGVRGEQLRRLLDDARDALLDKH